MNKIAITGMGAVTPIGIGVENYWRNLVEGKSGIGLISRFSTEECDVKVAAEVRNFDPMEYMPKRLAKDSSLFAKYAYTAATEAINESGIDCSSLDRRRGIVMGTAMSGIAETAAAQEEITSSGSLTASPRLVPKILGNIAAASIAIDKQFLGPCYTVSTACSSGADAIKLACMLLNEGEADIMLAVGAESILCPMVAASLASAKALSKATDPRTACCPFDEGRSGFVMGEGGGALVLEIPEHATKRGAKILGYILAASNNTDAYHITAPSPDGRGAKACMEDALKMSGLTPKDIDYINAHGTSTHVGDSIEVAAIKDVFKDADGCRPAVSSTKAATGHLMGAGGITEVIACILACRDGIVPPTINTRHIAEDCSGIDIVCEKARKKNVRTAMSNAFGFGGQNSCIIVSNK